MIRSLLFVVGLLLTVQSVHVTAQSNDQPIIQHGQPIQLIYPDAQHRKLLLNETSLALIASFNEPLVVLSATGHLHSGKSFLLNRLTNVQHGFNLGYTVDPMTRGLWSWSEPIQPNGTPSPRVLVIDTEGFAGDANRLYDSKIFAVTSLLSSHLLYNSVKMIDQSSIDDVEILARQTQLFAHRAQAAYEKRSNLTSTCIGQSESSACQQSRLQMPSFVWIAQDFIQDLQDQTADQWLHSLLDRPHHRETHEIRDDQSHASLTDIFPSVHCRTLFLPHTSKTSLQHLDRVNPDVDLTQEYRTDLQSLKDLVFDKKMMTPKGTGAHLVHLLRWLVEMVNLQDQLGVFPEAPSSWAAFVDLQSVLSIESVYNRYRDALDDLLSIDRKQVSLMDPSINTTSSGSSIESRDESLPPPASYPADMTLLDMIDEEPSPASFVSLKKTAETEALKDLGEMLTGWDLAYQKSSVSIKSRISKVNIAYDNHYAKRVDRLLRQILREHVNSFSQQMDDWHLSHPITPSDAAEIHYKDTIASTLQDFEVATLKFVDLPLVSESKKQLISDSERVGKKHLSDSADRVIDYMTTRSALVMDALKNQSHTKPVNDVQLKAVIDLLASKSLSIFDQSVSVLLQQEKAYKDALESVKSQLDQYFSKLKATNDQLVIHACKSAVDKASSSAERGMNSLHLPMDEQAMKETASKLISSSIAEQFVEEEMQDLILTKHCVKQISTFTDHTMSLLEGRNVNALKAVFTTPLARAAKRMSDISSTYWMAYTFRRDASRLAMNEIKSHVTQVTEYARLDLNGLLVTKMLEKFVERDLSSELNRLNTTWWRYFYLSMATMMALATSMFTVYQKLKKPAPVPAAAGVESKPVVIAKGEPVKAYVVCT